MMDDLCKQSVKPELLACSVGKCIPNNPAFICLFTPYFLACFLLNCAVTRGAQGGVKIHFILTNYFPKIVIMLISSLLKHHFIKHEFVSFSSLFITS